MQAKKKEEKKEKVETSKNGRWWLLFWFFVFAIWLFGWVFGFSGKISWPWRVLDFLVGIPILYSLGVLTLWKMAESDFIFTFMETGWSKVIVEGGQFLKGIMSLPGSHFNEKWEVTPDDPSTPTTPKKGWRSRIFYVGIFFRKLYVYHWSWSHMHDDGTVVMHDEDLNKIKLTREPFAFKFEIGKECPEDINGNKVELTFVVPGRIVGVYGVLFTNPKWFATMRALVQEVLKNFIGQYRTKEDLFNMIAGAGIEEIHLQNKIFKLDEQGNPISNTPRSRAGEDIREHLWEEFKNTLRKKGYLIEDGQNEIRVFDVVVEKGINIVDVALDPQAQEYATKIWRAEKEAEVITITAKAQAEAVSESIAGSMVGSYTKMTGKTADEVKQGIPLDSITPLEMMKETRKRQAIKENAYFEVEHPSTAEGELLGLISGWKRMPTGGGGAGGSGGPSRSSGGGGSSSGDSGAGSKKSTGRSSSKNSITGQMRERLERHKKRKKEEDEEEEEEET